MNDEHTTDDLVLLDLHYSGVLHGDRAAEVQARLTSDPAFQAMAEQYLTDWAELLEVLEPDGLMPEGAEERLIDRLSQLPRL